MLHHLAEEDDIGFYHAGARIAPRHIVGEGHRKAFPVTPGLAAGGAEAGPDPSVEFQDLGRTGPLMKGIDVLGYDPREFTLLFQGSEKTVSEGRLDLLQ